jgi:large subunit ribosomal protein L7/L12
MEEEFGVSAAAPVMVAAAGWAEADEKTSFDVILKSVWANKIAVIKVIREVTGLGLIEAKAIADNGWDVKKWVNKEDAEAMKAKLIEQGAEVELV